MITAIKNNAILYKYGNEHEQELCEEFIKEMDGYDINRWMSAPANGDRLADLGYYIGYKIVESYYSNRK